MDIADILAIMVGISANMLSIPTINAGVSPSRTLNFII